MDKNELIELVIKPIEAKGGKAYFVGGCVRDALLNKEPNDYDITTNFTPEQLHTVFSKFSNVSKNAEQFGVAMPIINGEEIEIATFRKDLTKGRHPEVSLEASIEEDAARRDFTINALYEDKDGNILDPTGLGLTDIKQYNLRFVGSAKERLLEDPLRAYRFVRFLAKGFHLVYSDLELTEISDKLDFSEVSKERKLKEIKKIFSSKYFTPFSDANKAASLLGVYSDMGLKKIFDDMAETPQSFKWHAEGSLVEDTTTGKKHRGEKVKDFSNMRPLLNGNVFDHTRNVWDKMNHILFHEDKEFDEEKRFLLTLSAILHDIGKPYCIGWKYNTWKWGDIEHKEVVPDVSNHDMVGIDYAKKFCKSIGMSNEEIDFVCTMVGEHMKAHSLTLHKHKFDILEFVHKPLFNEIMLVSKADDLGSISTVYNDMPNYNEIMNDPKVKECISTPMPKPILTGDILIEHGLKPSPLFKKMLRVAYRHQYERGETDKERLFNFIKNIKE